MIFAQRDPRWANTPLGSGPSTIGPEGCFLTSYAQVLVSAGIDTDPARLNQLLIQNGRYIDGDLLSDHAIDNLFPGIQTTNVWHFENGPANLSMINDNDPSTRFIIEIDFDHNPNDGIQTHFVTEASWDGTTLQICDPWYGEIVKFSDHYGSDLSTTIQKVIQISVPVASHTAPASTAPAPQPTPTPPQPEPQSTAPATSSAGTETPSSASDSTPVPTGSPAPAPDSPAPAAPASADGASPEAASPAPSTDPQPPQPAESPASPPPSTDPQPAESPASPPPPQSTTSSSTPVTPPNDTANATASQPQNKSMERLKSRKFWVTVVSVAYFLLHGEVNQAFALVLAYLGVQGTIDYTATKGN